MSNIHIIEHSTVKDCDLTLTLVMLFTHFQVSAGSNEQVYGVQKMMYIEDVDSPFTTTDSSSEHYMVYGKNFFYKESTIYTASTLPIASSYHFVFAFHDTYGIPTIVTNCSNNNGSYQFSRKLISLLINNIRHRKSLLIDRLEHCMRYVIDSTKLQKEEE